MIRYEKAIGLRYITKRPHPNKKLFIYNYTPSAQFDRIWDKYPEVKECRGLIADHEGNVIARPFSKFFNIEEHETLPPYSSFRVFDKLDGSLGILYWDGEKAAISTRGSFESEQAKVATEILNEKYPELAQSPFWHNKFTFLFEIIYPENRIVVDYRGQRDLILLTITDNRTGKDVEKEAVDNFCVAYKLKKVKEFEGIKDFNFLRSTIDGEEREGFVILFDNGLRVKMKYEEYVRLHRIVTGVTAKRVWEYLKDNLDMKELNERVPDEFNKWLNKTVLNLLEQYQIIEFECKTDFQLIEGYLNGSENRKDWALKIKGRKYPSILFNMLDGKNYSKIIWKLVKPKHSVPFKEEI